MAGNSRAEDLTTRPEKAKAVDVRCPKCGWRTSRTSKAGAFGFCLRCSPVNYYAMQPPASQQAKRDAIAKQQLKEQGA